MKFGVVNEWTTMNRFNLHTLQSNITHLVLITRKKHKSRNFEREETGKEPNLHTD